VGRSDARRKLLGVATSHTTLAGADLARTFHDRETVVLKALKRQPQFAMELAPNENRHPGQPRPVSEAVERCLNAGWMQMGQASSKDPRIHLTDPGRLELEQRRRQTTRDTAES
jgi:hypothetical protein